MAGLVKIKNLKRYFRTLRGEVRAMDDASMAIGRGETMGVVEESGYGKSTLGCVPIHLEEASGGQILFQGQDIIGIRGRALEQFRENAQMAFQDPYSFLNPRFAVEQIIQEPLITPGKFNRKEIEGKTKELMDLVGTASRLELNYPHELGGGRGQRVGTARALALDPKFITCDEPVSALDVSIQAQVSNLFQDLQQQKKLTYLFITHDLSIVYHISNHIGIMYLGQPVEICESGGLFARQLHPYTKALLSAIPMTGTDKKMEWIILGGEIISLINLKPGYRFAARCVYATSECRKSQTLMELEPGHFMSCWRIRGTSG